MEVLRTEGLPSDWRSWPWPASTQHLGTQWVIERRSVVLQVPSVVVPKQVNYLINPSHADFPNLEIGAPEDFPIDMRIARLR
jgi:RES domain-containing protein